MKNLSKSRRSNVRLSWLPSNFAPVTVVLRPFCAQVFLKGQSVVPMVEARGIRKSKRLELALRLARRLRRELKLPCRIIFRSCFQSEDHACAVHGVHWREYRRGKKRFFRKGERACSILVDWSYFSRLPRFHLTLTLAHEAGHHFAPRSRHGLAWKREYFRVLRRLNAPDYILKLARRDAVDGTQRKP